MPRGHSYSESDKLEMCEFVAKHKGNLRKAREEMRARGSLIHYTTLAKMWKEHTGKGGSGKGGKTSAYSVDQIQEAVKLLEVNNYRYPETIKQLSEINIIVKAPTLKSWWRLHGREVCEANKFKTSVSKLAENLSERHKDMVGLVYDAKELILKRFIELVPSETNLDKLANAYKVLEEASIMKEMSEKPMTLIQQFNNYISDKKLHEKQKDTDKGNIQDASLINE